MSNRPVEYSVREASEITALDLFEYAAGVPVTEKMVADRIAELLEHPPGCRRCRGRCRVAGGAKPKQVLYLVREWQAAARRSPASVHLTRRRGRRAAALR